MRPAGSIPRASSWRWPNIDRFVTLAQNMKVATLDLLATAAVRDASDGADFMREIERRPEIRAQS